MKGKKQREGYKPCGSVKNVSTSHCPPGWRRRGWKVEERGHGGGCQRSMRQMEEEGNGCFRFKITFPVVSSPTGSSTFSLHPNICFKFIINLSFLLGSWYCDIMWLFWLNNLALTRCRHDIWKQWTHVDKTGNHMEWITCQQILGYIICLLVH